MTQDKIIEQPTPSQSVDDAEKMRESFNLFCLSENPRYKKTDDCVLNRRDWKVWQAATKPQPTSQEFDELAVQEKEIAELKTFIRNAFLAHPDLDADVDFVVERLGLAAIKDGKK